jgi:hypothetical protein
MSDATSLRVTSETFREFKRVQIRLAQDAGEIYSATHIIAALIKIGNAHYQELLSALTPETETETET